ncbi:hypothetical protein [Bacillus suaedae]|uniref:Uncharacterized protein n=1 Tax=Halalkalibacter suaedae TaxID=2822140 RepID=A0A940WVA7_9BACI|nr:hypothetical protein [Bacillus suaedae]MBP3950958.1 hypothetical protein [Bacillus suaedae]
MRIIWYECQKAFTSPVIIGLMLLFTAYNLFLIFTHSSQYKEELNVANQLAETYGIDITDESMNLFQQDLEKDLAKLNEMIRSERVTSAHEFLSQVSYKEWEHYRDEEQSFFVDLQLKEMYKHMAESIDTQYESIHWGKFGEAATAGLSGSLAQKVRTDYENISDRFDELIANNEHKTWFFSGETYKMHSFLFRTLFGHLMFELLIIIVLATSFITNYEFETKTHLITYASKRGRRLMRDKLIASFLTATACMLFLFISTLCTYFIVFDYSHLWTSSISSALNWEYQLPYVSRWPMTFATFLLWSICLTVVCLFLFTGIAFVIATFVRNNYFSFFLFAIFYAVAFLLPSFISTSSWLHYIASYNLSQLTVNPHMFFMVKRGGMLFQYYEFTTVCAWFILTLALGWIVLKRFEKKDIY